LYITLCIKKMSEEIVKIAVLEQKLIEFGNIVSKIDSAIEKLSEVNTNITKMLAVHDEKIEQCNKSDNLLIKMIDELKDDNSKEHTIVVTRINELEEKVDEISKFRWILGGIGIISVIIVSTASSLLSGSINPFNQRTIIYPHGYNNEAIKK
jgi:hypothetical protein